MHFRLKVWAFLRTWRVPPGYRDQLRSWNLSSHLGSTFFYLNINFERKYFLSQIGFWFSKGNICVILWEHREVIQLNLRNVLFPYLLKTFMRWVSWFSRLLRPLASFMFTPKPAGHWMSIELDFFSIPQRSDLTFRWIILQRGLSINQRILGLSWILKLPQQRYLLCPICGNLTLTCLCYCS